MEWHDWLLWSIAFVALGGPVAALVLDRAVGISGRWVWAMYGLPGLAALAAVCSYSAASGRPLCWLIVWGVVGGVTGTVALDIVRLIGVRFKAFPMDMPRMFGAIALGVAPQLQAHVMTEMLDQVSRLSDEERTHAMLPRLEAMAAMSPARRRTAVLAMMHGLGHLSEHRRQGMLQTQMGILSSFPSDRRRALMTAMDEVRMHAADGRGPGSPLFAPPPHGMPKLPMATFREFVERAMPRTLEETRTPLWLLLVVGYTWHVINGITFGVPYTMLFGSGSWAIAFAWGTFVWAMMMILMPPMMPLVRFPRWFPAVPFLAHLAMAAPMGFFALEYVSGAMHGSSLSGAAHAASVLEALVGLA